MIVWQEELDWRCYRLYGLIDKALETEKPPEIALGERAFEIVLARRLAEGEETTWFTRHGSMPIAEVPTHWPDAYRQLVERRIALIESDRNVSLIERPEYKRRWNSAPWQELEQVALRSWLLDRLEAPSYWRGEPQLQSVAKLADTIRRDVEFMQVAELYRGIRMNGPDEVSVLPQNCGLHVARADHVIGNKKKRLALRPAARAQCPITSGATFDPHM